MNAYIQPVLLLKTLILVAALTSCSKPHDLDTPCPDFGKQCAQALINI